MSSGKKNQNFQKVILPHVQVQPEVLFWKLKLLHSIPLHHLTSLPRQVVVSLSYFSMN